MEHLHPSVSRQNKDFTKPCVAIHIYQQPVISNSHIMGLFEPHCTRISQFFLFTAHSAYVTLSEAREFAATGSSTTTISHRLRDPPCKCFDQNPITLDGLSRGCLQRIFRPQCTDMYVRIGTSLSAVTPSTRRLKG